MFNIGFGELAIICIVLIIAVGPERLPSMMKTLGKTIRTLRQASRDIRASTGIDELLREDFDLYSPPANRPVRPAIIPPTTQDPVAPAPVSRQESIEPPTGQEAPAAEAALLGGPASPPALKTETTSTRGAEPDTGREPTGHWHPALPAEPGSVPAVPAAPSTDHPDHADPDRGGPHSDQPKPPGT